MLLQNYRAEVWGPSVPVSESLHMLSLCSLNVPTCKQYYMAIGRDRNEVL